MFKLAKNVKYHLSRCDIYGRTVFHDRSRRFFHGTTNVVIGEISRDIDVPKNSEYVPVNYVKTKDGHAILSQNHLQHLRWMLQKDALAQDMFLLGPPGPKRRQIIMEYLELTQREVEYVALSRDTTESDLKQRREIRGATASYFDQSAVRAAIEGRVLVLDGIEKAERNVLPVLNNLLENREMHLEDGRFLIPAARYDKLLKEFGNDKMKEWRLERVDENFRIIALGLPVPRYPGNALDPPLRSRFQARHIAPATYNELTSLSSTEPSGKKAILTEREKVLAAASTIVSANRPLREDDTDDKTPFQVNTATLPDFPVDSIPAAIRIMENNPRLSAHSLIYKFYPYKLFVHPDSIGSLEGIFKAFKVDHVNQSSSLKHRIKSIDGFNRVDFKSDVTISADGEDVTFKVPCGTNFKSIVPPNFVENDYHASILADLVQSHAATDMCIVGPRGCGKSRVAEALGHMLGYNIETMTLYRDMSARELLQQRETKENDQGDTGWRPSPLVVAATEGRLLLLDGLNRLHSSTLNVLHRLIHERELQLYDGTRLLHSDRYNQLIENGSSIESLTERGVFRIHPAFRIIALAEPPSLTAGNNWLTPEVLTLFSFHSMRNFTKEEELFIINNLFKSVPEPLLSIVDLANLLRSSNDVTLKNLASSLSTRQLVRIAKRMLEYPNTSAYDIVQHTFLAKFLPNIARNALENACVKCSIIPEKRFGVFSVDTKSVATKLKIENDTLTIGSTSIPIYKTDSLTKVPDILFYDVPEHMQLLELLLQDFIMGNHLLLVGNQGVGKNKIADRLLQLINHPREYIQLHRDTTVHSLTIQPTVKGGIVFYEDSPLVKAVKNGYALVVDEADKAPTHVTCVLKSLVEKGEMTLSDGRRIIPKALKDHYPSSDSLILMHEDFRMIVLANRPGFPFLGNDFFSALGDLFSCHAVDNPSVNSELKLLQQYGPDVSLDVIKKIVKAFSTLRTMADEGTVTYPYSTREAVNIVKHLQKYPNDELASAISNVFDFDHYTVEMVDTLLQVLKQSGLPTKGVFQAKKIQKPVQLTVSRKSGLDVSGPKHGKIDPRGSPHVGGNTWAGGTGGRDTAGLGGKGGPYRLDAGHTVHQLSDEEKNDVPDHIKKAAREMNRRAFAEKLKEIKMSEYDAKLYGQFLGAVQSQIGALRGILSSLQSKSKERHWVRHQTFGDFDDTKIIEGLTGEQGIFKRRMEQTPLPGTPLHKPKRLRLLTDVSGSMYRFNSYDGRLERSLEASVLVMEALRGFESQIQYDIWGHSGETHALELISVDNPPKNEKERLQIIRTMHAHSQYCWSGDNTVPAVEYSMQELYKEIENSDTSRWDEVIMVILSDANLSRYGIPTSKLAAALTSYPKIRSYPIFIGSLGDQAESLLKGLPIGRAFICMEVSTLPQILQQIFASSISGVEPES